MAVDLGNPDIVRELVKNSRGETTNHLATNSGNKDLFRELIAEWVDLEAMDHNGQMAGLFGDTDLNYSFDHSKMPGILSFPSTIFCGLFESTLKREQTKTNHLVDHSCAELSYNSPKENSLKNDFLSRPKF
jgi:hypothetical protein